MGRPSYGNQTHFVKWDNKAAGGRWYECTIGPKMSDGRYLVEGHGGWDGHFYGSDLTPIGHTPSMGDEALAYWQSIPWYDYANYNYAFRCCVEAKNSRTGKTWVRYDDGSKEWVPNDKVHKVSRL